MACNDSRAIAIGCLILSKVFKYCNVERFSHFLQTGDTQFGFKKELGCNHSIYAFSAVYC